MVPLLGIRRRHCSLFFFSHNTASNFLFEEVASRRCSRSLQQQLEKVFAHRCGGSCTQNHLTQRRKEDVLYGSGTIWQSTPSFAPGSWLFLWLILWQKAEGQRLNALFCFSCSPVDKWVSSVHQAWKGGVKGWYPSPHKGSYSLEEHGGLT